MTTNWLKPKEIAERLNVSKRTVLYLIERGELPSTRLGPQTIRVEERHLNEYLEGRTQNDATTR